MIFRKWIEIGVVIGKYQKSQKETKMEKFKSSIFKEKFKSE